MSIFLLRSRCDPNNEIKKMWVNPNSGCVDVNLCLDLDYAPRNKNGNETCAGLVSR